MDAARKPANVGRPPAHRGGDPEEQQDAGCDDQPLPQAKCSFHATESSRMSDACGVGFFPISSRRAKIAAFRALNASTTAGSNWRPDSLTIERAANSKEKPFR